MNLTAICKVSAGKYQHRPARTSRLSLISKRIASQIDAHTKRIQHSTGADPEAARWMATAYVEGVQVVKRYRVVERAA